MNWRRLRGIAAGIAAFVVLLPIAALIVVQTNWFRNSVRHWVVSYTENATGGRVELGSFDFNPWHLRATVTGFVIHGTEPAGTAPFLQVAKAVAEFRFFPAAGRPYEIGSVAVDGPRVNVIARADGTTNIPSPKKKSTSGKHLLQTFVDLAVRHFELTNGLVTVESRRVPLDIRGNNLMARLSYDLANGSYQGQLSLQPLYFAYGRNTPVDFIVGLPVTVEGDRISIRGGSLSTPSSKVAFDLSLEDMRNLRYAGHASGRVSLVDIRRLTNIPVTAAEPVPTKTPSTPSDIAFDLTAAASNNTIGVTAFHASAGQSNIEGSGTLKGPNGNEALAFKSRVALDELGRALNLSARPEGVLLVNGNASLGAAGRYLVTGNVKAQKFSFKEPGPAANTRRIGDIDILSTFRAVPDTLDFNNLRLTVLGGEFTGQAELRNFEKYKVDGNLRNLDLETALLALGFDLPYGGLISGPVDAQGDFKVPGTRSLAGMAKLSIAPDHRGIPVSGRLNADYSGAADTVDVTDSWLNLPHTQVTFNGSANRRLNVSLTSRDLHDLLAAASFKGRDSLALNGGQLIFNGAVTGGFANPRIAGHVSANRFSVEGRQFEALNADVAAAGSGVSVSNASLKRGPMQAQLSASLDLKRWIAGPDEPIAANVSIRDGDLADIAVMAGQAGSDFSGALAAAARISGTLGNPRGTVDLQVANGTIKGEPFHRIEAQARLTDRQITIPAAYIQSAAGRVDLTGDYRHPRDRFTTGRLHMRLLSTPLDLSQIRRIGQQQPALSGFIQIAADVNGDVTRNAGFGFVPAGMTADLSGRNLNLHGVDYGTLTATARTNGQTVAYNAALTPPGSSLRLNGNTKLVPDYPTTADAVVGNFPIGDLLALASRQDIPVRGRMGGTAHFDGTMRNPQGSADLDLSRAEIYGQPVDTARVSASWRERSIEVSRLNVTSGLSTLAMTGRYDHPAGNLQQGNAQFDLSSGGVDLSRIIYIQKIRPGIGGAIQLRAKGAAQIRLDRKTGATPKILLTSLNASLAAKDIKAQGKSLGDLDLTANTNNGSQLSFVLHSGLGGASIEGRGSAALTGDYPINGQLKFANVLYSRWRPLFTTATTPARVPLGFDAATDGEISLNGPVFNVDQLRGSVRLTRLSLTTMPLAAGGKPIAISNQGPIAATIERGVLRIESARMAGPDTDISAAGTAPLTGRSLDLTVKANANLAFLPSFDPDIDSSGKVTVAATIRGSVFAPLIDGQMALNDAAFNYTGITNGISNANGVVVFNGSNAIIRNLTAESGGGKVNLTGFVGYVKGFRFGIEANAKGVRIRPQEGVSVTMAAAIRLTGTTQNSVASGNVTISQFSYNPKSDIGSILSRAAPAVQSQPTTSPLLSGMKLEILVRSATGVAVQASLAQNLQADVDLRVGGTAAQPAVLGRIAVNEGQLVFFGVSYTVNSGTISFYNPVAIQPVLDISLDTQTQGVHVTLKVTGPIDNMKLSYSSDPPLQFQEIVALLAAGQTPTSDPTLLANQPQAPQQSFQQMGESAILTSGLANPVANRLQRVFGVTQMKIAPAFQAGTQLPTARVTLQQQISGNVTFTYTSALDDPNGMIIRVEWAFSPQYSAVATRDQNGIFSINFYYKKHFR